MRKLINGVLVEMTAAEVAEMEALAAQMPQEEVTAEQRLAALEEALLLLLEGKTV